MATETPATTTQLTTTAPSKPTPLQKTTTALAYLYDPTHSPQPTHLRTRSLLRSLRYLAIFLFWRIFRYAKYAAIGAVTAAVAGTAVGSVVSGAAFVVAPTGILGGAGVGLLWAVGKFGWRRAKARVQKGQEGDARGDEREDAKDGEVEGKRVPAPRSEPW